MRSGSGNNQSRSNSAERETGCGELPGSGPGGGGVDARDNAAPAPRDHRAGTMSGREKAAAAAVPEGTPGPAKQRHARRGGELSKKDLLCLLSILEGELQARDEVIAVLSGRGVSGRQLEARYGTHEPAAALSALHLAATQAHDAGPRDDVYEKASAGLERMVVRQKETHRRMLEQLLVAERCHRRTLCELEEERRKHDDYMAKSDDFTNLLEQERERLKRVLEQERSYQQRKEAEHTASAKRLGEDASKLRALALLLADEQQSSNEELRQREQEVRDLSLELAQARSRVHEAARTQQEESGRAQRLEAELEEQTTRFYQEHEEMTAKLANEEAHGRQLRQRMAGLAQRVEELEEANRGLQRAEEELKRAEAEINELRQAQGNQDGMAAELETLRKRLLEMEGKDEEIQRAEAHSKELRERLQEEERRGAELKGEVGQLRQRVVEMEKGEEALGRNRVECEQLRCELEKEQKLSKELGGQLEALKCRMRELEAMEGRLSKTEQAMRDDLAKLKSFAIVLADERKTTAERLKQEEQKLQEVTRRMKDEQSKVNEVTEKLIDESKKSLKMKAELEEKNSLLSKERDELKSKLKVEESRASELTSRMSKLKDRLADMDDDGNDRVGMKPLLFNARLARCTDDDSNKVMELTQEIDRLKARLKQLEVVEDDLMKTEDEYDELKRRYRSEQDKAQLLFQQLEEAKTQIARGKAAERGDLSSAEEHEFRARLRQEETKSSHLASEVQALKEKLHELMAAEDHLAQFQDDFAAVQKRLMQEESRNHDFAAEVESLTKELDRFKRYGRALRPSLNGRKLIDVPVATAAVQTDASLMDTMNGEEDNVSSFIQKTMQEENHIMSNLRQERKSFGDCPSLHGRFTSTSSDMNQRKSFIPWIKKRELIQQNGENKPQMNGHVPQHGEMVLSHKQGQPLHIRVRPDHQHNTAMLEITSPSTEDISYTTTATIPTSGLQKPRITILPNSAIISSRGGQRHSVDKATVLAAPERASPVVIATIARNRSPDSSGSSSPERPSSPIQIVAMSATADHLLSPEPVEIVAGKPTIFRVSPEKPTATRTPSFKALGSGSSIITTEDNKIHIHLGSPYRRQHGSPAEGGHPGGPSGAAITLVATEKKEMIATGTILRRPGGHGMAKGSLSAASSKVTSSITITPSSGGSQLSRTSLPSDSQAHRPGVSTRIPVPRSVRAGKSIAAGSVPAGSSAGGRLEAGQPVRIELKKPNVYGGLAGSAGKN
ncbi:unnamed protein product [Lampetra fluviatilis]